MTVKIGINGFGRIGRSVLRETLTTDEVEVVAVNDSTDADMLAHLLKYDSVHGKLEQDISVSGSNIIIDGQKIKVFSERDPADLPWGDVGAEVVIESTGIFTKRADAQKHIDGGAKKVIISAPSKDDDLMLVLGVNEDKYEADKDRKSTRLNSSH